jgi:hypothetical protein
LTAVAPGAGCCSVMPLCGILFTEEYNALRHDCQGFFAALRHKPF